MNPLPGIFSTTDINIIENMESQTDNRRTHNKSPFLALSSFLRKNRTCPKSRRCRLEIPYTHTNYTENTVENLLSNKIPLVFCVPFVWLKHITVEEKRKLT